MWRYYEASIPYRQTCLLARPSSVAGEKRGCQMAKTTKTGPQWEQNRYSGVEKTKMTKPIKLSEFREL